MGGIISRLLEGCPSMVLFHSIPKVSRPAMSNPVDVPPNIQWQTHSTLRACFMLEMDIIFPSIDSSTVIFQTYNKSFCPFPVNAAVCPSTIWPNSEKWLNVARYRECINERANKISCFTGII